MAKEFKVKFFIDSSGATREIEGTLSSLNDFEKQIGSLKSKLQNLDLGSEEYKKVEKEINRTEKALQKAKDANKSWLDTIASAPGLVGTFGQSLQGIGKAFGNIGMAIKTSLIGLLATIIAAVVEKMKSFDGVMEPLNKILGIWSATMGKLANLILPAVVAVVESVANGLSNLVNLFSSASKSGKGFGDILSDMADRTNELDDAQADYEYNLSLTNAALAEAREIAADSTKSIEERRKAVLEAARIEEETAKEGKRIALERARLMAQQMAVDMALTTQEIENLKTADAARLRSFINQQLQNKALNGEKKDALLQQLAQINEIDATSSKIGKKTAATLKGIDNEVAASAKEAAQKSLESTKNRLDAQIELEKNKANTDESTLRKLLEQKDKLENQGTKKSKEELELQKQNREKAIKDALKADSDAYKTDVENKRKAEDEKLKIVQNNVKLALDEKNIELERLKILYGEDSKAFKDAQLQIYADRAKALEDEKMSILMKQEMSAEDADRLRMISLEASKLSNEVLANNKKEIDGAKSKLEAQKEVDLAELDYKMTKAESDFELQRSILAEQEQLEKDAYDRAIAAAGDDSIKKEQIELDYTKKKDGFTKARMNISDKEYQSQIAQAQGIANALGALSDLVGKDTLAGKALGISQALINTYVGASEVLKAKAVLPEPANTIVKIANLATTIATGLKTVREITAVQVPQNEVPEVRIRKQMGGVLQGPLHAMGGITTPFGELEGGEYVVNRASTMMMRPTLDRINALGGGNVDYQAQGFAGNSMSTEPPIFKTYVVASEMSSQQELDMVIKNRSKF